VIQRHFLPWTEPALPAAARFLADRYADGDALSLEGVAVVVQAARAGRRLTELLIGEAEERGLVLIPPEVTTPGHLPERLLAAEPRAVASRAESLAAWAAALRSLEPRRRAAVFPRPPDPDDLPAWIQLARLVCGLHEELAAEELDFGDVARTFRQGAGFDDSARWSVLAAAQEEARRTLEEAGRVERDEARWAAVRSGRVRLEGDLVLVGVVELAKIARRMLELLDGPVTALVHAPDALADAFDDMGCVVTDAWTDRPVALPDAALQVAGRPPEQADEVVRCLSGDGPALGPDEVTIGVPDPSLVPYLEQRLDAFGVPHRYAAGTPLPRTDPYRLLEAVASYLEEQRYPAFAALLRHPDVEARMAELGMRDALEVADRTYAGRLPGRVDERRDGPFRGLARALAGALELGRLRGRRPVHEWMEEVLGLLRRVYAARPLDRSRPGDRRLVEACEGLRDAAAAWAAPASGADEPCDAPAALHIVLGEARAASIPPTPDRSAVEMLGWLELHLDDAPVLVLTGLDEAHVPGSVDADLFLPDGLRTRLGLADDARRLGRDAYLLSAMLASRRAVRVVVGRRTADGDPLRPSRLLMRVGPASLPDRIARLFGDESVSEPLPNPGLVPADESAFRAPPEPVIRVVSLPKSLSVTAFRGLLVGPYQFALEQLLHLEERDDRARELDPLRFGELAHRVLQRFGAADEARSPDVAAARKRLDALVDEAVREAFGEDPLPAVTLQARQLGGRLAGFAEWHSGRLEEGWAVVALEAETPEGGVTFEVDGEPIGLTGRIDRVERHPETGRWAVLDYKTSAVAADPGKAHRRRDGTWTDLQLPLYRLLLPGIARAGGLPEELLDADAAVDLGYLNLSRDGTAEAWAAWTSDDLEDAWETARECVRRLRIGEFPWREAEEHIESWSPFAALLGRGRLRGGADEGDDANGEEP